jgi:hypothetical protein
MVADSSSSVADSVQRSLGFFERKQLKLQFTLAKYIPSAAWITTRASENFVLDVSISEAAAATQAAVEALRTDPKLRARYNSWMQLLPEEGKSLNDSEKFALLAVTKIGWLDPSLITLSKEGDDASAPKTRVRVVGWSAGFLPITVPGAPLLNVLLFWVPFGGVSFVRMPKLKRAMKEAASGTRTPRPTAAEQPKPV